MNQAAIIHDLKHRHEQFVQYINSLSKEHFEHTKESKWSAGQEVDHILRSLQPLADILANKAFILSKFGKGNGVSDSYEGVVNRYQEKLAEGGKASGRYLPEKVSWNEKVASLDQLLQLTEKIGKSIELYTEDELNELRLPHPLVGLFTIREMMYFTSYHVSHHQNNSIKNLQPVNKTA